LYQLSLGKKEDIYGLVETVKSFGADFFVLFYSGCFRGGKSDEITFPEDTTPRFSAGKLKISGNTLISTEALLEKLPEAYIVSTKQDDDTDKEIYDFRVVIDLIRDPGENREVSLKTIQGLTKYILSVYQDKGYAGIYVYVPADAVKEEHKLTDEILPIQIIEGRIAQISVDRYDFDRNRREEGFLKDSVIESWSPVREGDVIQKKKLDNFVRLLNLNPDRYVSPVISRSSEPNALNLSYDIYEIDPWHWYIQVDNAGTKDRQWSPRVGLVNTNLLGIDDRFSEVMISPSLHLGCVLIFIQATASLIYPRPISIFLATVHSTAAF